MRSDRLSWPVAGSSPRRPALSPVALAAALLALASVTILAALAFQHLGGYEPCALCLEQRTPYYLGIPLAAAALLSAVRGPRWLTAALFAAFGALMLYGLGLAVYHAGVEWRWWEGPASCATAGGQVGSAGAMLESLQSGVRGPSCTDAVWRFLGLSFAGWNAIVSASLVLLAGLGVARLYGSSSASQ